MKTGSILNVCTTHMAVHHFELQLSLQDFKGMLAELQSLTMQSSTALWFSLGQVGVVDIHHYGFP